MLIPVNGECIDVAARTMKGSDRRVRFLKMGEEIKRLLRLTAQSQGISLGGIHKIIPMPLDILGGAALVGNMLGNFVSGDHINGVPGANLSAMLAADAAVEVDIAPSLKTRVVLAGHLVNTVDRADLNAGFAASASVGVDYRHDLWDDFSRLADDGRRHEIPTRLEGQ